MGKPWVKHHPFGGKTNEELIFICVFFLSLFVWIGLNYIDYSIFSRGISPQNWQTGVGVASCCLDNGFEMSPSGGFHK
jgi:hypothetical protein